MFNTKEDIMAEARRELSSSQRIIEIESNEDRRNYYRGQNSVLNLALTVMESVGTDDAGAILDSYLDALSTHTSEEHSLENARFGAEITLRGLMTYFRPIYKNASTEGARA